MLSPSGVQLSTRKVKMISRRGHRRPLLLQSSSSSRFTAGAAGFFILSQSGERTGAIHRAFALDAFEAHLARMREHGRAIAFDMLVEAQAEASFGQSAAQRGLAHLCACRPQGPRRDQVAQAAEIALY